VEEVEYNVAAKNLDPLFLRKNREDIEYGTQEFRNELQGHENKIFSFFGRVQDGAALSSWLKADFRLA
jgi:hypothetical protein